MLQYVMHLNSLVGSSIELSSVRIFGMAVQWNTSSAEEFTSFASTHISTRYDEEQSLQETLICDNSRENSEFQFQFFPSEIPAPSPTGDIDITPPVSVVAYWSVVKLNILDIAMIVKMSTPVSGCTEVWCVNQPLISTIDPSAWILQFEQECNYTSFMSDYQCHLLINTNAASDKLGFDISTGIFAANRSQIQLELPIYTTAIPSDIHSRYNSIQHTCEEYIQSLIQDTVENTILTEAMRVKNNSCYHVLHRSCVRFINAQIYYKEMILGKFTPSTTAANVLLEASFEREFHNDDSGSNVAPAFSPLSHTPFAIRYDGDTCLEPVYCTHMIELSGR